MICLLTRGAILLHNLTSSQNLAWLSAFRMIPEVDAGTAVQPFQFYQCATFVFLAISFLSGAKQSRDKSHFNGKVTFPMIIPSWIIRTRLDLAKQFLLGSH